MDTHSPISSASAESSARACLLIVDDNLQLGSSLVTLFEHGGYVAASVRDGRSALHYLLKQRVDIVITDIFMPDGDGLELLRELYRRDIKPRIIAMTGGAIDGEPDMLHVASLLGAGHAIRKPFEPGFLLNIVGSLCRELPPPRPLTDVASGLLRAG